MQLQFSAYGFIVGVSIVVASLLIEDKILKFEKKLGVVVLSKIYYQVGLIALIFGVLGARVWHVLTDFSFYKHDLIAVFYIWNGGLSIIGGVLGGLMGIYIASLIFIELKSLQLLDFAVFGLPVGQAMGRIGNYMNQELYGLPTNGYLKIYIDEAHRMPGFQKVEFYHPLFLYELITTAFFAVLVHVAYGNKKLERKLPQIGSGKLFLVYILYYSVIRFLLDFLRIDRQITYGFLGTNQIFLLSLIFLISINFLSHYFRIITIYAHKK